jgi:exodeoxyribonuclease-5
MDECSMIGEEVFNDLKSFSIPILALGDPGQLPPIGDHSPFRTMKPDVFLDEVHRQAQDSPIIRVATQARLGEKIDIGNFGDVIIGKKTQSPDYIFNEDYQVICGTYNTIYEVTSIRREKKGLVGMPRKGEPVICRKNEFELGLYNGLQTEMVEDAEAGVNSKGEVTDRFITMKTLAGQYTSSTHFFQACLNKNKLQSREMPMVAASLFDFGYALTCHKAQGSQWDNVLLFDESRCFKGNEKEWLYTAITRAAEKLVILR